MYNFGGYCTNSYLAIFPAILFHVLDVYFIDLFEHKVFDRCVFVDFCIYENAVKSSV